MTKPTYKIINADCLDAMKEMADDSIDCVITDLPYGTTACSWDTIIPFEPMWKELKRITKQDSAITLFSSQPFTSTLIMSNLQMFRYEWVWEKSRPSQFLDANRKPLKAHENICIFSRKQANYFPIKEVGAPNHVKNNSIRKNKTNNLYGVFNPAPDFSTNEKYPRSIIKFDSLNPADLLHSSQKPLELIRYLIRTYSLEGETILDFTMGSGTTGAACMIENRNFIGVELDSHYFSVAEARIKRALGQGVDIPQRITEDKPMPLFEN